MPLPVSHSRSRNFVAALATVICCASTGHAAPSSVFYIREYRVSGSTKLDSLSIQEAVYPFLGPGRGVGDVDAARAALEKAFRNKGYQTVSVLIPQQDPKYGVIRLEVVEGKVGRLRVNGAKYFLPSRVKAETPELAEGHVPHLPTVSKELVALNRNADRKVTPRLRTGAEPGTVDIDLDVEDKLPLHGSLELNNRYNSNTTQLRLNGALSYGNLFQLGHTLGGNFQIAPEQSEDAKSFSGYYLARVNEGLSLMAQGSKQDSDVSTLTGSAVVGKGETYGIRAMFDLPVREKFYQTFSLGLDWKTASEETISLGDQTILYQTPIEYYPLSLTHGATWMHENGFTEWNTSLVMNLRGPGSDRSDFDYKRSGSTGSFVYLRSDLSHTQDLKSGAQLFGKLQGQLSSQALPNGEQLSAGGLGTVRGYLESTALGDNGLLGTLEWRTPSFIGKPAKSGLRSDEWRVYTFADSGLVGIYDGLPGQDDSSIFASAGIGSNVRYKDHYNASLDVAVPFIEQVDTQQGEVRVTFRGWADF